MGKLTPYIGIALAVAIGVASAPYVGAIVATALVFGIVGALVWVLLPYLASIGFCLLASAALVGVWALVWRPGSLGAGVMAWLLIIIGARIALGLFMSGARAIDRYFAEH